MDARAVTPRITRTISRRQLGEMIANPPAFTALAETAFGPETVRRTRPREESEARLLREALKTPERLIGPVVPDGTIYPVDGRQRPDAPPNGSSDPDTVRSAPRAA